MRFSIETADRQIREVGYPIALMGSEWQSGAEPACAHYREMEKRGGQR